jgi:hypothetical protein
MWHLWEEEAVLSAREEEISHPVPLRKRWEEPTGGSFAGASVTMLCVAAVAQPSGVSGVESAPNAESTTSRLFYPLFRNSLLFYEALECWIIVVLLGRRNFPEFSQERFQAETLISPLTWHS